MKMIRESPIVIAWYKMFYIGYYRANMQSRVDITYDVL